MEYTAFGVEAIVDTHYVFVGVGIDVPSADTFRVWLFGSWDGQFVGWKGFGSIAETVLVVIDLA